MSIQFYNTVLRAFKGCIMLFALAVSQGAMAHAEHDESRFVAENGKDSGRCDNRFRPCKTVEYAVSQAAKGDHILVAQGQYHIRTAQQLLYFSGELVPVYGGFDQIDQYQNQNPDRYLTRLTGVPADYTEKLSQRGFTVIHDGKSQNGLIAQAEQKLAAKVSLLAANQSSQICNNGNAGGFPCSAMALLAHIPLSNFSGNPTAANDIWGHHDLNTGREYALIGLSNGISVVEVSTPEQPVIVGSVSGQLTSWRDIKVWQFYDPQQFRWRAYAYATADNASEGVTIIDLSGLPDSVQLVGRQLTDPSAHNVYISNVDYAFNLALPGVEPLLHITGSNQSRGAFRSYRLNNPENLSLSYQPPSPSTTDYTHDASSLLINDSRAQTDCVNSSDEGCNVLLDFNEGTLRLWDHTLPGEAIELGSKSYPNAEYTHSGWWTEDKQYVIVQDELDEQQHALNTTINIFDISDLNQPLLISTWNGPTRTIDHNGFVRGNRYYMSNYERGVTVLDISDVSSAATGLF